MNTLSLQAEYPFPEQSFIDELLVESRSAIAKGSLSFSLASRLLPRKMRDAIVLLYHWCRSCDDRADLLPQDATDEVRQAVFSEMVEWTKNGRNKIREVPPAFAALSLVISEHEIPLEYPLELLEGMRSDLFHQPIPDEESLFRYSYRVAGTVGLIFSHISGVSDLRALRFAAHLGTAMQLTNIARDVFEDHRMGRVYLPNSWLKEAGIESADLTSLHNRSALVQVVKRLLKTADEYYQSGDLGLKYLPIRSAFAVCAARVIYSEIGRMVESRGANAWDTRCWISLPKKLLLIAKAGIRTAALIPVRIRRPFSQIQINKVWGFQWPEPKI